MDQERHQAEKAAEPASHTRPPAALGMHDGIGQERSEGPEAAPGPGQDGDDHIEIGYEAAGTGAGADRAGDGAGGGLSVAGTGDGGTDDGGTDDGGDGGSDAGDDSMGNRPAFALAMLGTAMLAQV